MSDQPQGEGWWQASDDKWYPPSDAPDNRPPPPNPNRPPVPPPPVTPSRRRPPEVSTQPTNWGPWIFAGGEGLEARAEFAAGFAPSGQLTRSEEVADLVVDLCDGTNPAESGEALLVDANNSITMLRAS